MTSAEIIAAFREAVDDSSVITRLLKRTDYQSAYDLVTEICEICGITYDRKIGQVITEDIIEQILRPLIGEAFDTLIRHVEYVQIGINESIGLGLGAMTPAPPNPLQIAKDMIGREALDVETIANYADRFVDDSLRSQASFLYDNAGIESKIIRHNENHGLDHNKIVKSKKGKVYFYKNKYVKPCKFCDDREGTHEYPCDTKYFERHNGCHCWIEFKPFRGVNKIVWNKDTVYKGKGKSK